MIVLVLFLQLAVATIYVLSLGWAWRDAESRGKPGFLVSLLVALLWPVALPLWFVFRPNVRMPGAPRNTFCRLSIGSLMLLTAVFAVLLLHAMENATYEVTAILRVNREAVPGSLATYSRRKSEISRDILSKQIVDQAVVELMGDPDEGTSQHLMKHVKVQPIGDSELVSVSLEGERLFCLEFVSKIIAIYLREQGNPPTVNMVQPARITRMPLFRLNWRVPMVN